MALTNSGAASNMAVTELDSVPLMKAYQVQVDKNQCILPECIRYSKAYYTRKFR